MDRAASHFKGAWIAQNKSKAVSIAHDSDRFAFLLQKLEIETTLKEVARSAKIVDAEIEVVELHETLLKNGGPPL